MLDAIEKWYKPASAAVALIFTAGTWFGACQVKSELERHVVEEQASRKAVNEKLDLLIRLQEAP